MSVKTLHTDIKLEDLVVMATDGVFDNVFDKEIIEIVNHVYSS